MSQAIEIYLEETFEKKNITKTLSGYKVHVNEIVTSVFEDLAYLSQCPYRFGKVEITAEGKDNGITIYVWCNH